MRRTAGRTVVFQKEGRVMPIDHLVDLRRRSRTLVEDPYLGLLEGYPVVIRAMQTLCENNVLGIVANGARAGELYSKYTYYYSKQEEEPEEAAEVDE